MTRTELADVLNDIQYKQYHHLIVRPFEDAPDRFYLQVFGPNGWTGRKWALSWHMTVSEVVLTAFKAFLTFEEHECREAFTYKGQKVLGPHLDLDKMAELLASGELKESVRDGTV